MKVKVFGGKKDSNDTFVVSPYLDSGLLAEHLAKYPYLAVKGDWINLPSGDTYKVLSVSGFLYVESTTYVAKASLPGLQILARKKVFWRPFYEVQLVGSSRTHWVPEFIVSSYLRGELLPASLS